MKNILSIFTVLILITFITCGCTTCICTSNNLYPIKQNNKIGLINQEGKEVVEAKYESILLDNKEKLIAVKFNGLWGFIDKTGEFKIIPQYKETKGFKDDLAYVKDDNFEGYINIQGSYVWKQAILKTSDKTKNISKSAISTSVKKAPPVKNDLADDILKEVGL